MAMDHVETITGFASLGGAELVSDKLLQYVTLNGWGAEAVLLTHTFLSSNYPDTTV